MHKRLLALALVLMGSGPSLTHALGLGDIEVYSALNQPLLAEIALSSTRPGEIDEMIVELAPSDAFSKAGVERPFYLTKLRFEVATKPDGTEYIKVTTDDPIREPFLNFLVDVDWPRGRLVREYTILLDPPVFASDDGRGGAAEAPSEEPRAPEGQQAASTAGEPALIERESASATEETDQQEFGYEQPAEGVDDSYAFEESGAAEEDTGFGVEPGTEVETSDLPPIEMADEAGEETSGAEVMPYDDSADQPETFGYEEPADGEATDFEEFGYDEEAAAPQEPADTYADEEGGSPAEEETAPESDEEAPGEPLPEIDLVFDETLPYDEASTNALMAQFAAEDEARDRDVQPPTRAGDERDGPDEHEVQAGDTLHEIASRYKAPDVTVNQAMLALLRYNPDAFIRDNINSVKKGFVLRVPDRESMLQIDTAEAVAEVRRQHALWREYRSQLAGAPSTTRDAQAADEMTVAEREASTGGDSELSIVAPGAEAEASERASGAQEGSETGSSAYVDLQLAREELEAERLEKQELQARITELNEQIEKQDRLISVQSEQLAQLQERLRELEGEAALPEVEQAEEPETGAADQPADEQTEETEPDTAQEETRPGLGMTLQGGDDSMETADEQVADAEAPADEPAETGDTGDAGPDPAEQAATDLEKELEAADEPLSLSQQGDGGAEQGEAADDTDQEAVSDGGTEQQAAVAPAAPGADSGTEGVDDGTEGADGGTEGADGGQTTASTPDVQPADPQPQPQPTRPQRPTGIAGYAYDLLPAPYNVMAADVLQSRVGLGVIAAVALLLVVMLIALVKPKPKPKRSAFIEALTQSEDVERSEDSEEPAGEATVEPRKASFGEKLSDMFAPITAAFGKKSKAEPGDARADIASSEGAVDQSEAGVEESDEIESFDDTAKAAAAGFAGEAGTAQTDTSESTGFTRTTQTAGPPSEPEEDASDDTTQEADVYLAYGLHDQAEELISQALASSPDNVQYMGKLLETYFAAGKRTEFEQMADKLHAVLGGRSSRVWDKTVAMGKEIAPDNQLFREADTGGLNVADFAPAKPQTTDLDLSEPQGSTTPDIAFEDDQGPASTTTDFELDLGEIDEDDKTEIAEAPSSEGGETELEFDLDSGDEEDIGSELNIDFNAEELGLGGDTDDDSESATESDADEQTASAGDTDLDMDDMDATVAMDLSFNLDDESSDDADSGGSGSGGGEELDAIELDSDLDLGDAADMDAVDSTDYDSYDSSSSAGDDLMAELDYGGEEEQFQEASSDTEFDISDDEDDTIIDADLDDDTISGDTNFDEVATKLDLAKAYMDMGDTDGASSTLEEVMAEGSDDQRREAEELLDQIN